MIAPTVRRGAVLIAALTVLGATIHAGTTGAATAADGRIAFSSYKSGDGDIYLVNADGSGEVNVTAQQPLGEGHDDQGPDWSPDGQQIAFTRYKFQEGGDVFVINPDGTGLHPVTEEQGTFEHPVLNSQPDWSPDGTTFVFSSDRDDNLEIWQIGVDGSTPTQLTTTPAPVRNFQPVWSPDQTKVAFVSDRGIGGQDIYVMNADGSGVDNVTESTTFAVNYWDPTWAPNAQTLAYTRTERHETPDGPVFQSDIWLSNIDGSDAVNLTDSPEQEYDPSFSPDGTEISFTRQDEQGNTDIWVMSIPTTAEAFSALTSLTTMTTTSAAAAEKVTTNGSATEPDWSASQAPVVLCQGRTADNPPATGVIEGTRGPDVLVGSAGRNSVYGKGGNDVICGGGGPDEIWGGDGNDDLFGQSRDDELYGGAGRDFVNGARGLDLCVGGPGEDRATACESVRGVP